MGLDLPPIDIPEPQLTAQPALGLPPVTPTNRPSLPLDLLLEDLKDKLACVRTIEDRKVNWIDPQDCLWCRGNLAFVRRFRGTFYDSRFRPGDHIKNSGTILETCPCGYTVIKSRLFDNVKAEMKNQDP